MSIVERTGMSRMRGFTALEVMVSMGLLAAMALVVQQTISTADSASRYMKAVEQATERSHNLSYELREHIMSSRRLFFDDAVGRDYVAALDLSSYPAAAGSRLPMIEEGGRLGPDAAGEPMTGNFLLFVGETDSTSVASSATEDTVRHIDTYRFHAIYTHETDRMVVTTAEGLRAFDLVSWQSIEYPNYQHIIAIDDEDERRYVISELVNTHGFDVAWDSAGDADSSFYDMTAAGDIAATPSTLVTIEEHPTDSRGGRLVYTNTQLARSNELDKRRRPRFSADNPKDWQPNGFEVKIVGRSGSRQVWMHLVCETQSAQGQTAAHASSMIISTKDL